MPGGTPSPIRLCSLSQRRVSSSSAVVQTSSLRIAGTTTYTSFCLSGTCPKRACMSRCSLPADASSSSSPQLAASPLPSPLSAMLQPPPSASPWQVAASSSSNPRLFAKAPRLRLCASSPRLFAKAPRLRPLCAKSGPATPGTFTMKASGPTISASISASGCQVSLASNLETSCSASKEGPSRTKLRLDGLERPARVSRTARTKA
mmetsp:Transcript_42082/g.97420  ORF Transcript_42082/g.97420 Transcript_42082/m.97420 type:complete len:205 (+) Transcript_42082:783-1397(+)